MSRMGQPDGLSGKLRIVVAVPNFFSMPLKRMAVESRPETGRTYFLLDGRIVAVARRGEESEP